MNKVIYVALFSMMVLLTAYAIKTASVSSNIAIKIVDDNVSMRKKMFDIDERACNLEDELKMAISGGKGAKLVIPIRVTAYSPTKRECDDTPFVAASNKRVKHGTIAISRDIKERAGLEFGDMVMLEDVGMFEVHDLMGPNQYMQADVFFFNTKKAVKFGERFTNLVIKKEWKKRSCNNS